MPESLQKRRRKHIMARNTRAKKAAPAPKVDIGAEVFAALRELEKTKGIPVDYMVEKMKRRTDCELTCCAVTPAGIATTVFDADALAIMRKR